MKNIFTSWPRLTIGIILGFFIGYFFAVYSPFLFTEINKNKISLPPSDYHTPNQSSSYGSQAQCTFNLYGMTVYENDLLSVESGRQDSMVLTFRGLDEKSPTMVGNMGDEVSLTKIDLGDTLYLIEQTAIGYVTIYTLFRDDNVALISKQYDLIGTPFGQTIIGECVSGLRL